MQKDRRVIDGYILPLQNKQRDCLIDCAACKKKFVEMLKTNGDLNAVQRYCGVHQKSAEKEQERFHNGRLRIDSDKRLDGLL